MSRINGLASFLRKEYARKQSGSKLAKAKKPEEISFSLVNGELKPLDNRKGKRFTLPDAQAALLKRAADQKCHRCRGSGISKWDRAGEFATTCACVRRRAAILEEALQFQKEQMERMLAEAKADKAKLDADIDEAQKTGDAAALDKVTDSVTPKSGQSVVDFFNEKRAEVEEHVLENGTGAHLSLWQKFKAWLGEKKKEPELPVVGIDFGHESEAKVIVLEKVPAPDPGYKVVSVEDVERMEEADEGRPEAVPAEEVSQG